MGKHQQINVDLSFRVNSQQAKSQMIELQGMLSKIAMKDTNINVNSASIDAASSAARELSIHLNNAFNATTGKLDLSKLDTSLKRSSQNIADLSAKLLQVGPSGEQAFVKLAQSIAAADRPVITINSKLNALLDTLKNTARWQISSSILHGFMGAIQQAYGYAQDLNQSLNEIRIVTGYNTDEMAAFAKEANKAAKSLSATTTEYTKASLIYYQQGLSQEDVKERTDITIKLANVSRQSAEDVSDQMTAVWNNFYDGSKSLEYYADVMTALGAATASSTQEIAGGLEKFAAIADTIGLSYEYAASALATITSNTRQSEEVVGTALKTIFARIQGLNLGETLEDGTDLNKYSEALDKVGIKIFDSTGEIKDMNTILDEMGEKWNSLSKDTQIAVAQAVAGTRQYNQLIALMDNWNNGDGDSFTANLETVSEADGALQDQANIYAESWEAARDRVTASLEAIYDQLLDDEFFIDIANGFSSLLDSLSAFIDGIGGVKTVLLGVASFFLAAVADKIQPALLDLKHTLSIVFSGAEKQAKTLTAEMNKGIQETLDSAAGKNFSEASKTALQNAMQMNVAKGKLQAVEESLTATEKQRFELELSLLKADQDQVQAISDKIVKRKEEIALMREAFDYEASTKSLESTRGREEQDLINTKKQAESAYLSDGTAENKTALTEATNQLNQHRVTTERLVNAREQYAKSLYSAYTVEMQTTSGAIEQSTKLYSVQQMMPDVVEHYVKALAGMQSQPLETQRETFARLKNEIELIVGDSCPSLQQALDAAFKTRSADAFKSNVSGVMEALKEAKIPAKDLEKILSSMGQGSNVKKLRENYTALNKDTKNLKTSQDKLNKALQEFSPKHTVSGLEKITSAAAGLGQVAMLAQSCRSIFSAWNNDDLSIGEKLTTTIMGISMAIPAAVGAFKSLNTALNGSLSTMLMSINANRVYNATIDKQIKAESQAQIVKRLSNGESLEAITNGIAESAVKKGLIKEEEKENYILALKTKFKSMDILNSVKNTVTKLAEAVGIKVKSGADKGETAGIWSKVVAYIAEQAAAWPVLAVTLLIVAAMAALAAVVLAVVSVVKALVAAYNKDAIAAEQAENAAKSLAETYQSTKQAYEDMIAAMENYETAKKSLEELTKGTEEYNKALQEANRAALELVNNYPEYFGKDSYKWENGQLILDEDAMANAQQQMAMKESAAYSAAQMGAAEAKHARNKADLTQLARDITPGDATGAAVTTGIVSALLGGPGSPFGLLALKIGGLTTTIMGVAEDSRKNAIELAAQEFQNNENLFDILAQQNTVEGLKEALGTDDNELVMALLSNRDALLENKDSIIELSNNMEAANQAEKLAAQQSFMEAMKATSYSNDKNADRMAYLGGAAYQEAQTEAYDRLLDEMSNKSKLKNYSSDYFDKMGLSSQDGFKVGKYDAKKGTVSYSYTDENGDTQEKEVSAMEIAQTLAVSEAMSSVTSSCQVLSEAFAKLDHDASATSEAMKEFLSTGDTTSLTKEQYDAMASMSEGELINYLENLGINEDVAKSMGYDNLSGMVDDMDLDSTGDKWAKYENITSMQGTGGLTLAQAENISSATNALGDFYGTDMANEMTGMMDTTSQTLDADTQAAFWSQLGNIEDYTDAQAWDDFLANMAEATDLTADEAAALEGFAKSAALAANATKKLNFDDLKKNVQGLQGVLKSMSSGNRNVSDEQMEMLKAQGIDTSKFAKTLDGWRYLGDTGEMVADISDDMRNQFKDVEQNFTNIAEEAAQAQANVEAAEAALAAAKIAGDAERDKQLQAAKDNVSAFEIIGEMMRHVVDVVTNGIKAAWDWICDVCLGIYDFFVNMFNSIGGGLSSAWNSFVGFLENLINGISKAIKKVLKAIGVNTDGWAEVHLERSGWTPMKTSEEIAAEKALVEAEEKLIESTQKIIDATPTLVDSIMASADYLTEAELEAKKQEMAESKAQAQASYDAAEKQYGKDSPQALYYKALVDSYNEQVDAYDKAIQSRRLLIEDIKKSERYEALNKSIADLNTELERTSSLKDRAFGAQRLQAIEKEAQVLQQLIEKEKEYQDEIDRDLGDQRKTMATKWGATFDANGNISNYDELLYNHAGNWESVKADLDKYDETKNNKVESENKITDYQAQVSSAKLEKITYKMEYEIEIEDRELEWLDHQLSKIADDFFSKAEAAALMIGTVAEDGSLNVGGKLAQTIDNTSRYSSAYSDLTTQHNSGEINQADYVEGMSTIYDNAMKDIEALNELDETMLGYYGETVAAASEELDKHTARMEQHVAVLDHYKNLLSIIGEEANYDAMGVILEGQAHMASNNVEVSTKAYEMWSSEAAEWKEKMEDAVPGSAEFELYQKNWETAEEKSRESQDKMLADLAAWAEAEKAILENTLSSLGKTLEESLTGGLSFDELSTQMERAQSLQEEYLTTTNQIYETTKMMRTAQQAIDASSNTVAKEKLKNFITETKSLQEQGKLSQYELDMQQAKYDLLVAEIALEEAQNAKSTVRLQRDSEGNFGYVYTADAGAVSEAQQQFDDAQNALYNKGLEGANDYAQKYNTTMQEMYDTFNQIQQDRLSGAFATEEEYNNAMAEAKAYYYQKLQDYSNLYGVAVSADSNIAAEAWSTDFASMINATDQWKQDVDTYMLGANEAFTAWAETVATIKETTGGDIATLSGNVKTLTDEHDTLTDAIVNEEDGLLVTMQSELDAVGNLTTAYATYRAELQETIKTLEAYAVAAKNAIAAESGKTTPDNPTGNNNTTNNPSSTPAPTTTGGGGGGRAPLTIAGGPNRSNVMVTMAATGGMTTNWGPEGKMMMVHENELILNSDQTNRFFENLALMESILATIDSYALNQQLGGTLSSPSYVENGSDVLEQNVKIEASFPGVTDRTEIEEAFNNLVNKASQYANRK